MLGPKLVLSDGYYICVILFLLLLGMLINTGYCLMYIGLNLFQLFMLHPL